MNPFQFVDYRRLITLRRALVRRPHWKDRFELVFASPLAFKSSSKGPVGLANHAAQNLGWVWIAPYVFRTQSGHTLDFLAMSESQWKHE
eukprot:2156263-Karenia_brevis.AAC.1